MNKCKEVAHPKHREKQTAYRLTSNDPVLEFIINSLIQEDQAEHGPAHAPLIGAVLKQHHLKEGRQSLRQQLRPLPEVLTDGLHA